MIKKHSQRLSQVYEDDQNLRQILPEIEKTYGLNSMELKNHWKLIHEKDSINTIFVSTILDEYGWLGSDIVGEKGNQALFLVIQHADINIQKKYLPLLRDAVQKNDASSANLAFLEDRIAMRMGEKQIYGTQGVRDKQSGKRYLYPVDDIENLDSRREAVGLNSISDYLKEMDIIWDLEEYKRELRL